MSMTTTMFWDLFKTTGSLEAYLLYRENLEPVLVAR
jgi:hypothetical protein